MWKKFRTPQEKKRLSLKRDRRPCYGETNKGPRKTIPLRKRLANQCRRRLAEASLRQIVTRDGRDSEGIETRICARDAAAHTKGWRKAADMPLRDFVARQMKRRVWRDGRRERKRLNPFDFRGPESADPVKRMWQKATEALNYTPPHTENAYTGE